MTAAMDHPVRNSHRRHYRISATPVNTTEPVKTSDGKPFLTDTG